MREVTILSVDCSARLCKSCCRYYSNLSVPNSLAVRSKEIRVKTDSRHASQLNLGSGKRCICSGLSIAKPIRRRPSLFLFSFCLISVTAVAARTTSTSHEGGPSTAEGLALCLRLRPLCPGYCRWGQTHRQLTYTCCQ